MMHWRRPNKHRKAPEYYLGDIVGKEPEPMRPVYRRRHRGDWVRGSAHVIVAVVAGLIAVALMIAFVWLLILFAAQPSLAQTSEEIKSQIRSDCRIDALHYCPKQAARCALREDQSCVDAIVICMQANKAKLKPNCQRWMW